MTRSILLLATAAALMAQPREWQPPAGEARSAPVTKCHLLRSLTGYEFTVITALDYPAQGGAPAFCRVIGQVAPEIRFEVQLPAEWNGRLMVTGNGGYAGDDLDDPRRPITAGAFGRMGFVTARTNTGHDAGREPLGTFAVDSQKLFDYAYRAIHVTTETAKKLTKAYYGSAPKKSYFQGCSTGGRQALMSAQRFPADFDGILAGAPVLDFSGTMLKYASWVKAQAANPIPGAKMKLLADRVYQKCDAVDGLKDGLIDDPRRCDFQPARDLPVCDGADGETCFTRGQIASLENIYGDVSVDGKRRFPGWSLGAEVAGANGQSGWTRWIRSENGESISKAFSESFFRYLAWPEKNPKFEVASLDWQKDATRLDWISRVLNATDTDLRAFRDRGGKLLMWFGWADPALNPQMGVEYYESVVKEMGPATGEFFRLFMMPGVFHCGGGVGCDQFARLKALIDWVENGAAPSRLEAARTVDGKVVRTRPLCMYPQVARYKGSGSVDDAASFDCVAPNAAGR